MTHILGIHHVQITVPPDQVNEARDFYIGVLELTEIEKPESLKTRGGFWLQVGDRQVHVGIQSDIDRHASKAHIAYQVADIDYWRKKLTDFGITIGDSIPIVGYDRFECRDPFGNRLEMIQAISD